MIRSRRSKAAPVVIVVKVPKIPEAIHNNPSGLQLKQITIRTAINKSTAYRFWRTWNRKDIYSALMRRLLYRPKCHA